MTAMTAGRSGSSRTAHLSLPNPEGWEGSADMPADTPANTIRLELEDLIPDRTGAVVIQTDGQPLRLIVDDFDEILTRGISPDGTLSEHEDVSGFDYVTFANGITVYFAADEVRLIPGRAARLVPKLDPRHSLSELLERELNRPKKRPTPRSSTR